MSFRYVRYDETLSRPNVVVDGSPNASTVLTLTHWPGIACPPGMAADLSAEMAFRFVRSGRGVAAEIVTNNHFDQDGLVAMFAFVAPEAALPLESLLIDLAAAGDFATYRDRRSARASMAIAAYADPGRSPLGGRLAGGYDDQCAVLYETLLPRVAELVLDPYSCRDLWAEEDEYLTASEESIAGGRTTIDEHPDADLAVVAVEADLPPGVGHRFGGERREGVHPMAINNATSCLRVLQLISGRFDLCDRYETWVQLQSRRPRPRVDLRDLATQLNQHDPSAEWQATAPSTLEPRLWNDGLSTLDADTVVARIESHLTTAPPAWHPYLDT